MTPLKKMNAMRDPSRRDRRSPPLECSAVRKLDLDPQDSPALKSVLHQPLLVGALVSDFPSAAKELIDLSFGRPAGEQALECAHVDQVYWVCSLQHEEPRWSLTGPDPHATSEHRHASVSSRGRLKDCRHDQRQG